MSCPWLYTGPFQVRIMNCELGLYANSPTWHGGCSPFRSCLTAFLSLSSCWVPCFLPFTSKLLLTGWRCWWWWSEVGDEFVPASLLSLYNPHKCSLLSLLWRMLLLSLSLFFSLSPVQMLSSVLNYLNVCISLSITWINLYSPLMFTGL